LFYYFIKEQNKMKYEVHDTAEATLKVISLRLC